GSPERSWYVMTSPVRIVAGSTGRTTASAPSGSVGSMEPLSTAYGVAPARRGTSTPARSAAPPRTTTATATARPRSRSAVRIPVGDPAGWSAGRLGVRLREGDRDVGQRRRQRLGPVRRPLAVERHAEPDLDGVARRDRRREGGFRPVDGHRGVGERQLVGERVALLPLG